MARTILCVGVEIPGGEIEHVDLLSRQTLLDADIIVFAPAIPYTYGSSTYLGKPCLSDDASFQVREALAHWRRELAAAVDAGKLVVVLLKEPEEVYAATGRMEYSGTGRNARKTRIVEIICSYDALPIKYQYHGALGSEMILSPDARFFAPYWAEFGEHSEYEAYLEGEIPQALVKTRTGSRVVGACLRKGRGALLLVPALDTENEDFVEYRGEGKDQEAYWNEDAIVFGRKYASTLVSLAEYFTSEASITPPPNWALENTYRLPEEAELERTISEHTARVVALEEERRELEARLENAGSLRGLLYEQGTRLEHAVLEALQLLGFEARGFQEGESEFDAVFSSSEGRFIGEVEGKDSKAINIDKFSQLERNLNEDFALEGVTDFAKGVLFGNAFRLLPPAERKDTFTVKCRTAAERLNVALVRTPDLFVPARYLKSLNDPDYAKKCREAILMTSGDVVKFPQPPVSSEIVESTGE